MKNRSYLLVIKLALFNSVVLVGALTAARADWYQPREEGGQNRAQAYALYGKALEAFKIEDYNTCVNLCRAARNFSHGNKDIVHLQALAHAQAGENYDAMTNFRAALQLDYNFIPCRNNYGLFLKKTGKLDEAKKMFEECIRIKPEYPDAYYHLGEVYKEKGDLDTAIDCFESATRLKPDYWEAQRDLGMAMYERVSAGLGGDLSHSLEKLQTAAKLVPNNPMVHYYMATIYCADGKLDEAESEYRVALMNDPKMAAGHFQLAKLRYFRGDPERCINEIRQAEKINPTYTDSKKYPKIDPYQMALLLARSYECKGLMIDAVDAWKNVAAMERNNQATLQKVALIEKNLRAEAKRKGKKSKIIQVDPQEVEAYIRKGINQSEDGDLEGARQSFKRASEMDPNNFEALQNIGSLLEASGDLNGALAKYQAAMALRPNFGGSYYNLAYLLEKMNLRAEAGMMYQKFHEVEGKYPYDPKHIIELQQEDARQRARQEQLKKRGY